jgi:chaperonin GroES
MKVQPIGGRVLVKRIEEAEVKKGGIIIPDTAKEKPQQGTVIAVAKKGKEDEPIEVKKGDRVLFGKYGGTEITIDGEDYLMMNQDDILGIIEE